MAVLNEIFVVDKGDWDTWDINKFYLPELKSQYNIVDLHSLLSFEANDNRRYYSYAVDDLAKIIKNKTLLIPEYLYLFFRTEYVEYVNKVTDNKLSSSMLRSFSRNLKIPLPDISIQQYIVAEYNRKIAEIDDLKRATDDCVAETSNYICKELGFESVSLNDIDVECNQFQEIDSCQLKDTWDFDSILRSSKLKAQIGKNIDVKYLKIGDLAEYNPQTYLNDNVHSVLNPQNISSEFNEIVSFGTLDRNKEHFMSAFAQKGDVVVTNTFGSLSQFRCAIVDIKDNENVYISNSLSVLRCNDMILPKYLYYFMQTETFKSMISTICNNNGLQKIFRKPLLELSIPVPDLATQTKFVHYLDNVKGLVKEAREKIAELQVKAMRDFETTIYER